MFSPNRKDLQIFQVLIQISHPHPKASPDRRKQQLLSFCHASRHTLTSFLRVNDPYPPGLAHSPPVTLASLLLSNTLVSHKPTPIDTTGITPSLLPSFLSEAFWDHSFKTAASPLPIPPLRVPFTLFYVFLLDSTYHLPTK